MSAPKVLRRETVPKESVRRALSRDWFDTAAKVGKGTLADAMDVHLDTIDNAITERKTGLPELHNALNSLNADPSALLNTLLLFGVVAVPVEPGDCDDSAAISAMLKAASEYFERMKDGRRDHRDTLALAELFRPLIPAMLCVVREAAQIRGGGR